MASIRIFTKKFMDENKKMRKTFQSFWIEKKFFDLNIKTQDGYTFPVHKVLLCSLCDYFKDLAADANIESELTLDVDSHEFESIVKYIYNGKFDLDGLSLDSIIKVYKTAKFLKMSTLKEIIQEHLSGTTSFDNCLEQWRASIEFFPVTFRRQVESFIKYHTEAFLNIYLSQLSGAEFLTLLRLRDLSVSNADLYVYSLKWLKHDFSNHKPYMKYVFENIKFSELPLKVFLKEVPLEGITMAENKLIHDLIISQLRGVPRDYSLPRVNYQSIGDTRELVDSNSVDYFEDREKNRLIITENSFNKLNLETKRITKLFEAERDKWFSCSLFDDNKIFFNGGFNTNKCEYFYNDQFYELPPIKQSKWKHSTLCYNDKIYSCGGQNKNSMEIFDLHSMRWIDGPPLNFSRWSFGLVERDGVLYVVGGNVYDVACNSWYSYCYIEKFDPRTNKWQILHGPREMMPGTSKAVHFNNDIYGFKWNQLHQYNVKNNEVECVKSVFYPIGLENIHFGAFQYKDRLCVLGQNEKKVLNYFEFNPVMRRFQDYKIFSELTGSDIHIV